MDTLKNTQEGGDFRIEDARPEDVERIRAIAKDAWVEIYPNETHDISQEDIEAIDWFNEAELEKRRKKIREGKQDSHTWVLKDDKGNVVGFCKVSKDGHKTGEEGQREIDAMYLVPELQGKGLGKKLMEKALEWLGADGDIRLEVVSYNNNAINFYKRFGFQETDLPVSDKRTQLPSGKQIPRIVMLKTKIEQKNMELVKPSIEYKESFIEAIKEFQAEGNSSRFRHTHNINIQEVENNFDAYLKKLENHSKGIDLTEGYVPASVFWLVEGKEVVGIVLLRHKLNENLLKMGGHIGYGIRPTKRKMGYGAKILELALKEAKKLGIKKALVSCDDDNTGSWKIIEKNGGVLENKVETEGKLKRRYWIEL